MNKFLITVFFLGITTLLIGARFGFVWAGGAGYEKPLTASVKFYSNQNENEQTNLVRGDEIGTKENEFAIIKIGEQIKVTLDQRTDIIIEQLFPSQVEIKIIRGRLLAKTSNETKKLIISSPETSDFVTTGLITAVRYDWLGQSEIALFENFTWKNSSATEFYEWALSELGFLGL